MSASLFAISWSPPPLRYRLAYSRPADASIRTLQPYSPTPTHGSCPTVLLPTFRPSVPNTHDAGNTTKTLIVERYQELARIFTNVSLGTKLVNTVAVKSLGNVRMKWDQKHQLPFENHPPETPKMGSIVFMSAFSFILVGARVLILKLSTPWVLWHS